MLTCDLVAAMNSIAPLHLAEEWDNVGLLVGDPARPLGGGVLLTIDLTAAVVEEALAMQAGAIIAYHPPIFRPLKSLTARSPQSAALLRLIESRIALFSPHTALDAAPGGVTDWLIDQACEAPPAQRVALTAAARIDPHQSHKIVTFVPKEALDKVRGALAAAGAGVIGHYELCSFSSEGTGTFRGDETSNPTIGSRGRLEHAPELRLEMVCGQSSLPAVIEALRAAHPYEEPAYDLYALAPKPQRTTGAGRLATLNAPDAVESIAQRLKSRLRSASMSIAMPDSKSQAESARIHRLAAVPGSGASLLDAAIDSGAVCFITGEMKHHEILHALDRGCSVILAGHTETERGYLPVLGERLNAINPDFRAAVSRRDHPPLQAV